MGEKFKTQHGAAVADDLHAKLRGLRDELVARLDDAARDRQLAVEYAIDVLGQIVGDVPASVEYWWCGNCSEEVDGSRVTFQEMHDTCGYPVESRTTIPTTDSEVPAVAEDVAEPEPGFHVYFMHDRLTPDTVRAALNLPEFPQVGDVLDFPESGYMGAPARWRVKRVDRHSGGRSATVFTTDAEGEG